MRCFADFATECQEQHSDSVAHSPAVAMLATRPPHWILNSSTTFCHESDRHLSQGVREGQVTDTSCLRRDFASQPRAPASRRTRSTLVQRHKDNFSIPSRNQQAQRDTRSATLVYMGMKASVHLCSGRNKWTSVRVKRIDKHPSHRCL